jgi:hypothetical protein
MESRLRWQIGLACRSDFDMRKLLSISKFHNDERKTCRSVLCKLVHGQDVTQVRPSSP